MGDIISLDAHREAARLKAIRERLPENGGLRWVARRKAAVVAAIDCGAISQEEAQERYALSEEELESWRESMAEHGVAALHINSGGDSCTGTDHQLDTTWNRQRYDRHHFLNLTRIILAF